MTDQNPSLTTKTLWLISLLFAGALSGQQPAHHHGRAQINVAIEEPKVGIVELLAPGEAIYGFEHQPRDAEERQQLESGLERLRSNLPTMLRFDPDRDCRLTVEEIVATSEGSGHGEDEGHGGHESHCEHEGHGGHEGHCEHEGHDEHERHCEHEGHDEHESHCEDEGHGEDEGHSGHEGHSEHEGHGGHHSEVHVEVVVRCQKALAGSHLRFAITDAYPELVELEVTVLSVERQSVHRIERDRGHVEL